MLLNLEHTGIPMKRVFQLSEELKMHPEKIALTQALTLNKEKAQWGLKGSYGLYGSQEWWDNIERHKIPLLFISGVISRTYVAGQDESNIVNSFELLLDDGSVHNESIYVNDNTDAKLFSIGHIVLISYVLDELKLQPAEDGGINYLDIVLEMAVSLHPVKLI